MSPTRALVGTSLAAIALVLLLSFKTPETTGLGSSGNVQGYTTSGTHTGQLTGSAISTAYGVVQVQLTLVNGRITDIAVLQAPSGGHDGQLTSYATPILRSRVLAAQSASVDTVSGATYTSVGYLRSVQSALDLAGSGFVGNAVAEATAGVAAMITSAATGATSTAAATATSGTTATGASGYSGSVTGNSVQTRYGAVQVSVTISNGKITAVTVLQAPSGGRDGELTAYATPILQSRVLAAQSAAVDTVSGATYTSVGYLQSVQSALDKAGV